MLSRALSTENRQRFVSQRKTSRDNWQNHIHQASRTRTQRPLMKALFRANVISEKNLVLKIYDAESEMERSTVLACVKIHHRFFSVFWLPRDLMTCKRKQVISGRLGY